MSALALDLSLSYNGNTYTPNAKSDTSLELEVCAVDTRRLRVESLVVSDEASADIQVGDLLEVDSDNNFTIVVKAEDQSTVSYTGSIVESAEFVDAAFLTDKDIHWGETAKISPRIPEQRSLDAAGWSVEIKRNNEVIHNGGDKIATALTTNAGDGSFAFKFDNQADKYMQLPDLKSVINAGTDYEFIFKGTVAQSGQQASEAIEIRCEYRLDGIGIRVEVDDVDISSQTMTLKYKMRGLSSQDFEGVMKELFALSPFDLLDAPEYHIDRNGEDTLLWALNVVPGTHFKGPFDNYVREGVDDVDSSDYVITVEYALDDTGRVPFTEVSDESWKITRTWRLDDTNFNSSDNVVIEYFFDITGQDAIRSGDSFFLYWYTSTLDGSNANDSPIFKASNNGKRKFSMKANGKTTLVE